MPFPVFCLVACALALTAAAPRASAEIARVSVLAGGRPITLAGPAIIQDGVVMVPFQGLFAPFGIRATWDPQARVLTLRTPAGDEMELRSDDPYATVNGERRPIPVPLVAVLGRVLVPAEWIFNTLGDTAVYDRLRHVLIVNARPAATPAPPAPGAGLLKVLDVAYESLAGGGRVVVTATRPLQATEHVLRAPDRIVLDVAGAVFVPVKQALDVNDGLVVQVRAAQFQRDPDIVRIVVELSRPVPYTVHAGAGPAQMVIDLGAAAQPGLPRAGPGGPTIVAIDPGHGGSDPGAVGPDGVREKDVVLAIARDLRALLSAQRIAVVMVRDSDVFVPLDDRARIAARSGATIFISIHANASVDANANGVETFYWTPQSEPLAAALTDAVSRTAGVAPRGVAAARFAVLMGNPDIPAVLVETAFVTNPWEERLLADPAAQERFAHGILNGLQQYLTAPAAGTQPPAAVQP